MSCGLEISSQERLPTSNPEASIPTAILLRLKTLKNWELPAHIFN